MSIQTANKAADEFYRLFKNSGLATNIIMHDFPSKNICYDFWLSNVYIEIDR